MNKIKRDLITEATQKYERIYPCATKGSLGECFTTEGNLLMFWFNTQDQSTHVLAMRLP